MSNIFKYIFHCFYFVLLQKPVALQWEETRQAKRLPPACPPLSRLTAPEERGEFSEDCLYLNIFAPRREVRNRKILANKSHFKSTSHQLSPILVLIHGGAFGSGSSRRFEYRELGEKFGKRGIMVVTVQYRLGVLGTF